MFPEWLQLQTSNLVSALLTYSNIYKCKIRSQGSKTRSRDYISNLQTAVNSSATARARKCNFLCASTVSSFDSM